ncbi:phage holin family protein [Luteibacter sp. NPDC031894]|uniref:phage holin family protein n=1 Tax=Luteibacter sp. NPDC031894 TaxID=3390572 RepID=UPI003D05FA3D
MNLEHLFIVLAILTSLVFMGLWAIGLFDDKPPAIRTLWVAAASVAFEAAVIGLTAVRVFAPQIVDWLFQPSADTFSFNIWSGIVLASCVSTSLRLLLFRRGPSRHRAAYAWLSWCLVVALTATAAKVAFGVKPPPGVAESLLLAVFTWRVFVHRGNLAHLLRLDIGRPLQALARLVTGRAS